MADQCTPGNSALVTLTGTTGTLTGTTGTLTGTTGTITGTTGTLTGTTGIQTAHLAGSVDVERAMPVSHVQNTQNTQQARLYGQMKKQSPPIPPAHKRPQTHRYGRIGKQSTIKELAQTTSTPLVDHQLKSVLSTTTRKIQNASAVVSAQKEEVWQTRNVTQDVEKCTIANVKTQHKYALSNEWSNTPYGEQCELEILLERPEEHTRPMFDTYTSVPERQYTHEQQSSEQGEQTTICCGCFTTQCAEQSESGPNFLVSSAHSVQPIQQKHVHARPAIPWHGMLLIRSLVATGIFYFAGIFYVALGFSVVVHNR